jgi:rod shape-determining protein MreC
VREAVSVVSRPFLVAFERTQSGARYVSGWFTEYDQLRESVDAKDLEIATWQKRLANHREVVAENDRLREMLDFERTRPQYTLKPATVLQHSHGVLTVDVGARHGVRPGMCVITSKGVIGVVSDQVWPFTSNVITLQHVDCKIDAMIERTRVRGLVVGTGNELSAICEMRYVDLKADVREGEAVVTSPDSVFPSGLPVGWSMGSGERGQLAQSVNLVPAANIFQVDEVFILMRADVPVDQLKFSEAPQSLPEAEAEPLPDVETLQERYAP